MSTATWRVFPLVYLVCAVAGCGKETVVGSGAAEDTKAEVSVSEKSLPSDTIQIGQPIADAKRIMKDNGVDFGEGGFAFAKGPEDEANLYCSIDANHTSGCIFYSKSTQSVTDMSLVFFPSKKQHSKGAESWLRVSELTFYDDGTYSATFTKLE